MQLMSSDSIHTPSVPSIAISFGASSSLSNCMSNSLADEVMGGTSGMTNSAAPVRFRVSVSIRWELLWSTKWSKKLRENSGIYWLPAGASHIPWCVGVSGNISQRVEMSSGGGKLNPGSWEGGWEGGRGRGAGAGIVATIGKVWKTVVIQASVGGSSLTRVPGYTSIGEKSPTGVGSIEASGLTKGEWDADVDCFSLRRARTCASRVSTWATNLLTITLLLAAWDPDDMFTFRMWRFSNLGKSAMRSTNMYGTTISISDNYNWFKYCLC